jgi:hypothetical protein
MADSTTKWMELNHGSIPFVLLEENLPRGCGKLPLMTFAVSPYSFLQIRTVVTFH